MWTNPCEIAVLDSCGKTQHDYKELDVKICIQLKTVSNRHSHLRKTNLKALFQGRSAKCALCAVVSSWLPTVPSPSAGSEDRAGRFNRKINTDNLCHTAGLKQGTNMQQTTTKIYIKNHRDEQRSHVQSSYRGQTSCCCHSWPYLMRDAGGFY